MQDLSPNPFIHATDADRATITVDTLAEPYIIAHRGGIQLGPEHALATYQAAIKYTPLIEQDVHLLPDGTLAVMHDTTADRTSTGTGTVTNYAPHQWKGLSLKGSVYHKNYPDIPNGCLTMDEVFTHFLHQNVVFVTEVKPNANQVQACQALVSLVQYYKLEKRIIVQGWSIEALQPAIDAGLDTLYLWGTSATPPSPSDMASAGVKWASPNLLVSTSTMQSYANAGLKVVPWTLHRQYEMTYLQGFGASGCFTNDPAYLCGDPTKYKRTSSNFGSGLPDVGMSIPYGINDAGHIYIHSNEVDINRGTMFGQDTGGYLSSKGCQFMKVSHGYLCPLPTSCTINLKGAYTAGSLSTTRWFSVFLGVNDTDFMDGDTPPSGQIQGPVQGYHILFRINGKVDIYKVTANGTASQIATSTGTFTASKWTQCSVTISPSKITATNGTTTTTTTDTTYRPLPFVFTAFNRDVAAAGDGDFYIADINVT